MVQETQNIDTMIQSLEESIQKAHIEEKRLNEQNQTGIPLPIKYFLHTTLSKFGIPGLNVEALINSGSQLSMKAIDGLKREFREDPKKVLIKAGIAILVLGIILKTIKNISTLKRKENA